jgi:hypothetical protein
MVISSTGNVGIGTSSAEQKLDVVGAVNLRNSGRRGTFEIDSSGNFLMGTATTAGNIIFETGHSGGGLPSTGTERVKINQYGIGLGLATPSSGAGITFPATQSASSDANTLDDYEEGSWTGAFTATTSGTITIGYLGNYDKGFYTKVGRLVTVTGDFYVASVSSPVGALRLTGLPFPCANDLRAMASASIYPLSLGSGATTSIVGVINQNTSYIIISKYAAGTTSDLAGDIVSGSEFRISVTYMTD